MTPSVSLRPEQAGRRPEDRRPLHRHPQPRRHPGLSPDILVDEFREALDDFVIVEIHAFEDLLDLCGREFEGVLVRNVADDEVDVLILTDEVREAAGEVALGLQIDVRALVGGVDLRPDAHLGLQVELSVAHLRMELQERDAHPDLALLAARIELVVDRLDHVLRHTAAIVDDLDGKEVARRAVLHLDGDFGGTRPDGIVGDVDDVQVETFHVRESLVRPAGGRP